MNVNKLFTFAATFGNKDTPLYPIIEELDAYRSHCVYRKQEIEELINLLSQRVMAEQEYSRRLMSISASFESIKIGLLATEVEAFKGDCHSKGRAAAELGSNINSDCIGPLHLLLQKQEVEFKAIISQSRAILHEMEADNYQVQGLGSKYFDSSESAEKFLHNYQELKLLTAMPHEKRVALFNSVMNQLNQSKTRAEEYREFLPDANVRLSEYYSKFSEQKERLVKVEAERCEQVHSAIG